MFGRDEKVSEFRLTAAQYIILAIFLVLAYGLWKRLLRFGGGEEPHPQRSRACASRQDSRSRRPHDCR